MTNDADPTVPSEGWRRPPQGGLMAPRWKLGQSGNPGGMPKAGREAHVAARRLKLSAKFVTDLSDTYQKFGKAALERLAAESPNDFLKLVVHLLPRTFDLNQVATQVAIHHWNLAGLMAARDRLRASEDLDPGPADCRKQARIALQVILDQRGWPFAPNNRAGRGALPLVASPDIA